MIAAGSVSKCCVLFAEHVDDIITLIYQYINMLKKEGPQQWVFQECRVGTLCCLHLLVQRLLSRKHK